MSFAGIRKLHRYGLTTSVMLHRLGRLGIELCPYVVYLEQAPPGDARPELAIARLSAENLESVLARCGTRVDARQWRQRIADGEIGVTAQEGEAIVGHAWASLRYFGGVSIGRLFPLAGHEAYLFDLFVRDDHRGRGLAIDLRRAMARELAALGRTDFYSYALWFNTPARRFKQKLHATPVELRFAGNLFSQWSFDFRLRRYTTRTAAPAFASTTGGANEPL